MKADATDIFRLADKDCNPLLQWTPDGKSLLFNPRYGRRNADQRGRYEPSSPYRLGGSTLEYACSSRNGTKFVAIVKEMATMGLCVISKNSRQVKWLAPPPVWWRRRCRLCSGLPGPPTPGRSRRRYQ